jgi:hypothetical protein
MKTTHSPEASSKIEIAGGYYIRAEYFYYAGTFNSPADGALRDVASGRRLEFATRAEAEEYLTGTDGEFESMGCREHAPGKFSPTGTYYLSHGEYSSPTYTIRKVPARA